MLKEGDTFFTSVGCMDGRVQEPITKFGQELFGAEYPDTITEAGLVGQLANNPSQELLNGLKFKIDTVSFGKHNSKGIVVHGHEECAGNQVPERTHKEHIIDACQTVKGLTGGKVKVVGVYVRRSYNVWEVERVTRF